MKIEFDPNDKKQVESVLKMLKSDNPDLWIRINYIPISEPLWEIFDFQLQTKLYLKRHNLRSLKDLSRLSRKKALSLETVEQRGLVIVEDIESKLAGQPWKTKRS